jgi:hypothetical protein
LEPRVKGVACADLLERIFMSIDTLIQQLHILKKMHVREIMFHWDDYNDGDNGAQFCVVSNHTGIPTGKACIMLGGWGENSQRKFGNEPHRFE